MHRIGCRKEITMKFFNRKRYTDPSSRHDEPLLDREPEVPVHEVVPESQTPQWDCAKVITSEEAAPGTLPAGWYVWVQSDTYYGLKPNELGTGLIASPGFQELPDIQNWLGLPIPASFVQAEKERRDEAKRSYNSELLKELEAKKWEAARTSQKFDPRKVIEEFDARKKAERMQNIAPQNITPVMPEKPNRRRTNEVHIRFSDEEYQQMQDRAAASCLPMSIFMRQAILTGEIKADPHRDILIQEIRNLNCRGSGETAANWADFSR